MDYDPISVALKFGFLVLLYLFLLWISRSALKDRASYQLDPARPNDAWLCAERDAAQGADILMVKPGLPYLDLLRELSRAIRKPWAVYHVSG